mmetsp:Transcript_64491/g.119990  ORF Transcript_64491/g.119990 Transcript_64491/m.119990 type:complete len:175 (-) Transcript_64491:48-572(-)
MPDVAVEVKWASAVNKLVLAEEATIGNLRDAIEDELSIPKAAQKIICGGKQWQGIAFPEDLEIIKAAGKEAKVVDEIRTVKLMLMTPPTASHAEEVDKANALIDEAREVLKAAPAATDSAGLLKALRVAEDILVKAQTGLDNLDLVGKQKRRRRELIQQAEVLGKEIDSRKASL